MQIKIYILLLFVIFSYGLSYSQHDHLDRSNQDSTKKDTMKTSHSMDDMGSMSHAFSLNLRMTRNGSGTGWSPDTSPMYAYMFHAKKWMFMVHGNVFVRYTNQDFTKRGFRGNSQFDAPN